MWPKMVIRNGHHGAFGLWTDIELGRDSFREVVLGRGRWVALPKLVRCSHSETSLYESI